MLDSHSSVRSRIEVLYQNCQSLSTGYKCIILVNFTDQGLRSVKEVPNRQDKSRETAKKFGVERKDVWMTFGPYDFVHLYGVRP